MKCHAYLAENLLDPSTGHSLSPHETAFALVNKKMLFDVYKDDKVWNTYFVQRRLTLG